MLKKIKFGAIFELPAGSEKDYSASFLKRILHTARPKIIKNDIMYDQTEYSKEFGYCLCTLYGALTSFSQNTNLLISGATRYKLAKTRYEQPDFQRNVGGYFQTGCGVVCNELNGVYYRIPREDFIFFMNLGISINVGIYLTEALRKAGADIVLTKKEIDVCVREQRNKKNRIIGHSVTLYKNTVFDNYFLEDKDKSRRLFYTLEDLNYAINSGFFWYWGYVLVHNSLLRDCFNSILKPLNKTEREKYFLSYKGVMNKREEQILQWCIETLNFGEIKTEGLKNLSFDLKR